MNAVSKENHDGRFFLDAQWLGSENYRGLSFHYCKLPITQSLRSTDELSEQK